MVAAYHPRDNRYDSHVIRLDLVFVFPDAIRWKPKVIDKDSKRRWNGAIVADPKDAQIVRDRSDERALADQAKGKESVVKRISQERREELKAQGLQHCPRCDQDKPIAEFRSNGHCRPCGIEYDHSRAKTAPVAKKPAPIPAESKPVLLDLGSDGAQLHSGNGLGGGSGEVVKHGTAAATFGKASEVLATSPAGAHYRTFAIEPIQYIEANQLPFHEANVVKYVSRWKLKNGVEDLKKARFYIDRLIELQEAPVA